LTAFRGWKWTVAFGAAGAAFVLLLSAWRNPFDTTLLRSLIAFAAFTAIAHAARYVLTTFLEAKPGREAAGDDDLSRGRLMDVTVPDEGASLARMIQQQWLESKPPEQPNDFTEGKHDAEKAEFKPLEPKRLTTLDRLDPQKIAGAIRQMTDEEGR